MRSSGVLIVASTFIAMAIVASWVIRVAAWEEQDFALVAAAIVASQVGAVVWHRQSPASAERRVKLGLGIALSVTALVFSLTYQAATGWLRFPEVVIPIATIGCFVFPFGLRFGMSDKVGLEADLFLGGEFSPPANFAQSLVLQLVHTFQ